MGQARSPSSKFLAAVAMAIAALAGIPGTAVAEPGLPTGSALVARSTPELIARAQRNGVLSRDEATLYYAYALGRPESLPAEYRSSVPWDGTLVDLKLRQRLSRMDRGPYRAAVKQALASAATPSCSSATASLPNTHQSTHFLIHYNAASLGGGMSITDYAVSLETGWSKEVGTFGWAAPPVAPNPPAGNRYHVRIDDLGLGLYGFVSSSGTHAGFVGNNPATSWNDGDALASCMVLNDDYAPFPGTTQQALDATTSHEFNHSLQFGYGGLSGPNVPDDVFIEGGATWMEDEVFDSSNDNYNFLWPQFAESMGAYGSSPYPYWVVLRGLTERYGTGVGGGGEQVMQDFWEETSRGTGNNLTAMQTALANRGTTLADAFHALAVAVKFNKGCTGGYVYPYCLEEGSGYVATAGSTTSHAAISAVGGSYSGSVRDDYALNWISLPVAGTYSIGLANTSGGGSLRASVVCDSGTSLTVNPLPSIVGAGGSTTLPSFNSAACTSAVAVITNQAQTSANPSFSALRSYQLTTQGASGGNPVLTVGRSGSGAGTVTSNPPGINCGSDCSEAYSAGTSVALSASPAAGSRFVGWSGDCTGTGPSCAVTMNTSKSAVATFEVCSRGGCPAPTNPTLTVGRAGTGAGTVTSNPSGINCGQDCSESYPSGTPVTLTATAAAGSAFAGWSGACSGSSPTCNVTMDSNKNVTATFNSTAPVNPTLAVSKSGSGTGTVTSSPSGINCGQDCSESYASGTQVTLTATQSFGSTFLGWSGACTGSSSNCTLTMDASKSVTASFGSSCPRGCRTFSDAPVRFY